MHDVNRVRDPTTESPCPEMESSARERGGAAHRFGQRQRDARSSSDTAAIRVSSAPLNSIQGGPMLALSLALLLISPPAAPSHEASLKTRLNVEDYLDWEQVSDPRISPDGARILYTRQWVNRMEDKWDSAIWIMNADGSKNRFLVEGSGARWSPDGTRIAYLAEGAPKGMQLFTRWMDAEGGTSQISRLDEPPSNFKWSPDGRSIAFTMVVPKKDNWKIDMPEAPKGSKWTDPPRLIETRNFRADRQGFLKEGFTHIFVVTADGGTPRQITEGSWNVGGRPEGLPFALSIDWTRDGREIVFDGLKQSDAENRYRESHIYAVDV